RGDALGARRLASSVCLRVPAHLGRPARRRDLPSLGPMRVVLGQYEGVDNSPALPLAAGCLVAAARADPELAGLEYAIEVERAPRPTSTARSTSSSPSPASASRWRCWRPTAAARSRARSATGR